MLGIGELRQVVMPEFQDIPKPEIIQERIGHCQQNSGNKDIGFYQQIILQRSLLRLRIVDVNIDYQGQVYDLKRAASRRAAQQKQGQPFPSFFRIIQAHERKGERHILRNEPHAVCERNGKHSVACVQENRQHGGISFAYVIFRRYEGTIAHPSKGHQDIQ